MPRQESGAVLRGIRGGRVMPVPESGNRFVAVFVLSVSGTATDSALPYRRLQRQLCKISAEHLWTTREEL